MKDYYDQLMDLPPGFRFHPTDEEIITHYLKEKVMNKNFTTRVMGEADLNKCEPWDLPKKAKMMVLGENNKEEWFFFSRRDRKYPTGKRANRATESGYWKATGRDKEIIPHHKKMRSSKGNLITIGMRKTLVFYRGRVPKGNKTDWVMHEYRLQSYSFSDKDEEWVVCRIFLKNNNHNKNTNDDDDNGMRIEKGPNHASRLMDNDALIIDASTSYSTMPTLVNLPATNEDDKPAAAGSSCCCFIADGEEEASELFKARNSNSQLAQLQELGSRSCSSLLLDDEDIEGGGPYNHFLGQISYLDSFWN